MRIFLDSDVVISSLISSKGAAYLLIHEVKNLDKYISNISVKELVKVCKRLDIDEDNLGRLIKKSLKIIRLKEIPKEINKYTFDVNDAHILAGAKKAGAKFLITYNIRDFKMDKIKDELNLIVATPARFIQYLRSIS